MAVADDVVMPMLQLDGVSVGEEEGRLIVTRRLTDDETSIDDVLSEVHEHGLVVDDVIVDIDTGEVRATIGGGH